MGKLIIAPSGTGKTYFVKHNLNWIDLDGYVFGDFMHSIIAPKKISDLLNWYDYNIISTSKILADYSELHNNIKYIILPCKEMKYEILDRVILRDRSSSECLAWYLYYKANWEKIIEQFEKLPFPKIYLAPGQYISDVIDEEGNAKEGVKIVY